MINSISIDFMLGFQHGSGGIYFGSQIFGSDHGKGGRPAMMNRIASATVKKEPFSGEISSVRGKCGLRRENNHWLLPESHTDRPLINVNSRKISHYQRSELTAVFANIEIGKC